MRNLIQHLTETPAKGRGTTLVIGAGHGSTLALLRRLGGERLVLVEPVARQADALAQRIDPGRGEEVWPLAVTY